MLGSLQGRTVRHTFPDRAGYSLIELVVAVAVLLCGLLAYSRAMSATVQLEDENRQQAMATAAAQAMVEELYSADPAEVFALYNGEPADDPGGAGTAPGSHFAVSGLLPRTGDADGKVGEIVFPCASDAPGILREDLPGEALAIPLDLNLDGLVDGGDHAGDYLILPVLVRLEWQHQREQRQFELRTILGAR
jgi:prepilin-type N-terminal cleavage/methylation domain-containing protein